MNDRLSTYFLSVLSYFGESKSPPQDLLTIKFEELLVNIISDSQNMKLVSHFKYIHSQTKVSIRDIMESSFNYNMTLEEYAKLCARSLSTFKSDFQKIYNTSPGKWLIKKRLDYAKFLVETTDKNISDISFESGFINTSHFIRIFKEKYGYPPLRYRKS
jgi:transcriptional regulator GlxA family with amidase domain